MALSAPAFAARLVVLLVAACVAVSALVVPEHGGVGAALVACATVGVGAAVALSGLRARLRG